MSTAERGSTLFGVLVALLLVLVAGASAMGAVEGDLPAARNDHDRKRAWEAAQAGVEWYAFQLTRDPAYWTTCTAVPPVAAGVPAPVNAAWDGTGTDPRIWRPLPQADARYTVELLPADGQAACDPAQPQTSMLQLGTLRLRVTGQARGERRSLIATFKRRGFLDFLYFTDFETLDPVTYDHLGNGASTWAQTNCAKYWRDGRGTARLWGSVTCTEIQFTTGDAIDGPLHTNDGLLVCGAPRFGRAGDRVEMSGPAPGYRVASGCSDGPQFGGARTAPATPLPMPPSNASLKALAAPAYRFTGRTSITLDGTSMTVTNAAVGTKTLPLPAPNGVVYVSSAQCGTPYRMLQDYTKPSGCGEAVVRGTYGADLTIGADDDIVIDGDVRRDGDRMLGLIANNFVRVQHKVMNRSGLACQDRSPVLRDVTIEAAILALQHSFIVDNYFCGGDLGTLHVDGAIAQRFRGPVGTGGEGSVTSGFLKDYTYDDRLKFREPPNFIDPVQAAWQLVRVTEQVPAR
ncbi:PilX N-terminal domain-containing pilus assembly protein [Conexibacter sp. SYSU D00693]|uniref:PilX N-terminal domain-containing pilus assembly protein n=1 Tax=Conexibacter sp. SYSU D00693 TaxID=2812560 RepID=UPI00196B5815|nr:PilX N-terminal domain-containing pilus assembly protein [Conexibacter sp. SYSU D00693]